MRMIGSLDNEKKAFHFYSILLEEGIHSSYEKQLDPDTKAERVYIWIYEEDAVDRAIALLEEYKENPKAEKFAKVSFPQAPPQPPDQIADLKKPQEPPPKPRRVRSHPFTFMVILLCVFLYLWNGVQQYNLTKTSGKLALQLGMTPIQQDLMFDYPQSNQEVDALLKKYPLTSYKTLKEIPPEEQKIYANALAIPSWKGFLSLFFEKQKTTDTPQFTKIKDGQYWRLITPIFLHGGLLHILFNMAWAWLLLRQVEDRLSLFKLSMLIILIGVVSNVAQYLVSGPFFLGFSGVVCGLVGFIWMRQRVAPWEGYPLQRSTIIFIVLFVAGMFALELITLFTKLLSSKEFTVGIANTAHIVGGLFGALLGRIPFFARRAK